MEVGQVIHAKDEFELYNILRADARGDMFIEGCCVIYHIQRLEPGKYLIDVTQQNCTDEEANAFHAQYTQQDIIFGYNATDKVHEFGYRSPSAFVLAHYTASENWTELYEVNITNPEFEAYERNEARKGFDLLKKALS